jgi:hypothetical protein
VPILTDQVKVLRQRLSELGRQPAAAELDPAALKPLFVPSIVDLKVCIGSLQAALCDDR